VSADEVELESGWLAFVHKIRTTADVDDGLRQCLVKRNERVAVTGDAGLVAECLADRLTEDDRDVFYRVVGVDLRVARGSHGEIGQRVLGERGEHVVEERHRRVDLTLPRAVEVEFEFDGRLRCAAGATGSARNAHDAESIEARASRNAV